MSTANRRHYRVARKETQMKPANGVFIPKKKKKPILAAAILLLLFAFIKGLIVGVMLARGSSRGHE